MMALIAHAHPSRIGKRAIAEALLSQLSQADRVAVGRQLLISTTEPALFAALSAAARDVETAALRLARADFEKEC
ncbi:MAG: hypothetical protein JXR75_13755 [Rhodobacteraceae bacterium]|nr:hypothetical protein [Paracoccaceae bacterium]